MTLVAYLPAINAGVIWDDDAYLTQNPFLENLSGLKSIWIPGNTPQYYPAVFTMFWLEHKLWGIHPSGYHLVNILLHALNALLVWRLCRLLKIPGAWLIGAVFALHPVHVESVAWITERKNVLSGVFYLASALCYLNFEHTRDIQLNNKPDTWKWYGLALILFILALLAKTVTCSLPAALILAMLWQRKQITILRLLPLAPMFVIGVAMALNTAHLEKVHVGAMGPDFDFSFVERLLIASKALLFYPQKLIFPWPLIFIYPRWELTPTRILAYWPAFLIALVAVATLIAFLRGIRGPALALAFFAGTLFPALGFFNVYPMRYSFVADHFQYLASLGLIALVVGGITRFISPRQSLQIVGALVLSICTILTWRQSLIYVDLETLWQVTLQRNPNAWIAHNNLARLASDKGEHKKAIEHLNRALASTKSSVASHQIRYNKALALDKLGHYDHALGIYLDLQQESGGMQLKIARSYERLQLDDQAEQTYRQALNSDLRDDVLLPYAVFLMRLDRPAEAIEFFAEHIEVHPEDADARMFLADALAQAGRLEYAVETAEQARRIALAQGNDRMAALIALRLKQFAADSDAGASE